MYEERMRRNIRAVIIEHGFRPHATKRTLNSIAPRHLWNVERGLAQITVHKLEEIANEIGADFLEFFRK